MRRVAVITFLFITVAAGCGDNLVSEPGTSATSAPGNFSSVGGAQVSHSKSFMLVTSVASTNQLVSKSTSIIFKPAIGAE